MATILRGAHQGEARVVQWANDWFSVTTAAGRPAIISPVSIQLTDEEAAAWIAKPVNMDREYDLQDDGRFKRKPRPPRQRR